MFPWPQYEVKTPIPKFNLEKKGIHKVIMLGLLSINYCQTARAAALVVNLVLLKSSSLLVNASSSVWCHCSHGTSALVFVLKESVI